MASHCAEGNSLMDNHIEKTMAINVQEAAYSHEVPLDLHLKGADYVDAPDTIIVLNFQIEVDYRSWGIKDINVSIRGGIDVEVEAGDQVIPVKVDFLEVTPKITWVVPDMFHQMCMLHLMKILPLKVLKQIFIIWCHNA